MNNKDRVALILVSVVGVIAFLGAIAVATQSGSGKSGEYVPAWAQDGTQQRQQATTSPRSSRTTTAPATSKPVTEYDRWKAAFTPYMDRQTKVGQAYDYHKKLCQTLRDGGSEATGHYDAKTPAQVLRADWGVGDANLPAGSSAEEKAEVAEKVIIPTLCPDLAHYIDEAKDPNLPPVARIGFGNGKYLVGGEGTNAIQPGTYTTNGQVSDCYWERSDSQGNILDNNFVSIAPSLTVTIYETDAGFTSQRCGMWTLVG